MTAAETTLDLGGLRTIAVGDPDAARVVVVLLHGFQMVPAESDTLRALAAGTRVVSFS